MRVLGLDPSLSCTGWGIVAIDGTRLTHIANGQVPTDPKAALPVRLLTLFDAIGGVIAAHGPALAAVEEVFVNSNAQSTLKLAQARGSVLAACARGGIAVSEHSARAVKKAIVGTGNADKAQVQAMIKVLLPGVVLAGPDAADALAVAIAAAHGQGR